MAQADWRRYYVPVFEEPSGRGLGTSRHVAGNMCYFSRDDLFKHNRHKGRIVAVLAVRGKPGRPDVQRQLYARAY